MKRSSVGHLNCSIARTVDVVGEWWSLMIIRSVFLGIRRFDDIREELGISRNILSDRLSTLVAHDVLTKVPYSEHPERFEYRLTEKGIDLQPVLVSLMRWGDKWDSPDGPPLVIMHKECGHDAAPALACTHCGELIGPRDVRPVPGPGWTEGH